MTQPDPAPLRGSTYIWGHPDRAGRIVVATYLAGDPTNTVTVFEGVIGQPLTATSHGASRSEDTSPYRSFLPTPPSGALLISQPGYLRSDPPVLTVDGQGWEAIRHAEIHVNNLAGPIVREGIELPYGKPLSSNAIMDAGEHPVLSPWIDSAVVSATQQVANERAEKAEAQRAQQAAATAAAEAAKPVPSPAKLMIGASRGLAENAQRGEWVEKFIAEARKWGVDRTVNANEPGTVPFSYSMVIHAALNIGWRGGNPQAKFVQTQFALADAAATATEGTADHAHMVEYRDHARAAVIKQWQIDHPDRELPADQPISVLDIDELRYRASKGVAILKGDRDGQRAIEGFCTAIIDQDPSAVIATDAKTARSNTSDYDKAVWLAAGVLAGEGLLDDAKTPFERFQVAQLSLAYTALRTADSRYSQQYYAGERFVRAIESAAQVVAVPATIAPEGRGPV